MNVMITGTGRHYALGFNLVLRYLENGDNVIATVRKKSDRLNALLKKYPNNLHVVTTSEDVEKDFFDFNLDYVSSVIDVAAVGPLRVIQKFYPLLANTNDMSLIINISSEAGSISKCYQPNQRTE